MAKKLIKVRKPSCKECKKSDEVVMARYPRYGKPQWLGWECERCYCVVKEIYGEVN